MNQYLIDVVVEFERSGKRISMNVPVRQLFFMDRHSIRDVSPDGTVVYRLPRRGEMGWMDRMTGMEWAQTAR